MKDYPELEYMTIDSEWGDCTEEGDAPVDLVFAQAEARPAVPVQGDLAWDD